MQRLTDGLLYVGFGAAVFLLTYGVTEDATLAIPAGIIAGVGGAMIATGAGAKITKATVTGAKVLAPVAATAIAQRGRRLYESRMIAAQPATPRDQGGSMIDKQHVRSAAPAERNYEGGGTTMQRQRQVKITDSRQPLRRAHPAGKSQLHGQLTAEIAQINTTLKALGVNAGTKPQWTQIGGSQMVFYTIKAGPGQKIDAIKSALPELSEAISGLRRKQTLVRLLRFPIRLEVEHPFYAPLYWDASILDGQPNEVLIGKTYDNGPSDMRLPMSKNPHILVAGTTGSGKSVLINAMVLSIAWNTSPDDLVIYLIDMKNKSLAPLRKLPHVKRFVSDPEGAELVIGEVGAALDAKIQNRNVADRRQHLLVIDEYADLSDNAAAMDTINHIVRMGREDAVNLIIGTQHPTSRVLGKDGTKQNFPVRIVGSVTDTNAANVAAGMAGTGAHLLPTERGAFLVRRGAELNRVNTYLLTNDDVAATVQATLRKWGKLAGYEPVISPVMGGYGRLSKENRVVTAGYEPVISPVMGGYDGGYDRLHTSGDGSFAIFPISEGRPLTNSEKTALASLTTDEQFYYRGELSISRLCKHVYGSKDPARMEYIKDALPSIRAVPVEDKKIIRLRKAV